MVKLGPVAAVVIACVCTSAALAQAPVAATQPVTANPSGRKYPARVYNTVRVEGKGPVIDGRLDDAAWLQGEWAGQYTQNLPTEGAAPSQPTELKILYDERNVYIAIRAFDDPAKVHRYPGRRDDFSNYAVDIVGVCFDSYNDKKTGFEFDLTAGGAKIDLILGNGENEWDTSWNAVWDGEVAHDERGWTAEFRVPLSQLRYGPQEEQVWGLHAWRWIARSQEEDQWQLIPRQNTGRMHQLGELRGIRGLPPTRHVELLPFALGKASSGPSVSGGGTSASAAGGLDAKIGLTSNITLDATVNPDFGQVEADPSVINLTAYETFFDEKRPFFLEGRAMFTFAIADGAQTFYSRRIGEAPSYVPPLAGGEDVTLPESTTILGAFKVTGKTDGGLSVAALQAFTQEETVSISSPLGSREAVVEPFGSYTIGRVQKDWNKGATSLGGTMTSTHRWESGPPSKVLPAQATTGGVDFTRYFANRAWVLDASGAFSLVSGDSAAIRALQRNPVHYYQRPDAIHLGVDAARTSLSGHGGSAGFGRSDTSRLRLADRFHWYSPGFDLNEVGYLRQADVVANEVIAGWTEPRPKGLFRSYSSQVTREDRWDFGGLQTRANTIADVSAQFSNRWRASGSVAFTQAVDTRALRGGPALRLSDLTAVSLSGSTDSSRRASLTLSGRHTAAQDAETGGWLAQAGLRVRPTNRILLTASVGRTVAIDDLQYVATAAASDGPRWVLGRIDQDVWDVTFRVNVTITPEFTVQYYGSPFIATGRYSRFKKATDSLAEPYDDRFHVYSDAEIDYLPDGNRYAVTEASGTGAAYSFANPDFSFRQFRSNLVARWEYTPGSSLYVVWSQGRTNDAPAWDGSLQSNWSQLWQTPPDNVLLVKISYWLSR